MKNIKLNLVALIGIFALGIGAANASSDCGDDDVKPISTTTHSSAKSTNKET